MIYIPYLLYKIDQKYKKSEVCFGFNYYEGYKLAIENFSIAYVKKSLDGTISPFRAVTSF